jgi:hypothetical protein
VGFVVDILASAKGFSEYFGFPCQNRSFHQFLHPHNHPGQVQQASIGRSAEWTQYGFPHHIQIIIKKKDYNQKPLILFEHKGLLFTKVVYITFIWVKINWKIINNELETKFKKSVVT